MIIIPKPALACILWFLSGILLLACGRETIMAPEEHREDVEQWRANRIERLTAPDGWLSLGGLYWFEEPVQRFGTADDVDFHFPAGSIAEYAGEFELRDDTVLIRVADGVDILADGKPLTDSVIFTPDHATELKHGRLTWVVIQREDLTGIRLYDTESHILAAFNGIESYPTDLEYRTIARLVPHDEQTFVPVTNILGQTTQVESAGRLEFELGGETHSLITLGTGDRLFIIIADETSRTETYPGGRYIYVDNPGPGGYTVLDFNKAYNPPCAFSPYTTCQLPPDGNTLPVAVRAGEKLP
jgi:uncharacterized protein